MAIVVDFPTVISFSCSENLVSYADLNVVQDSKEEVGLWSTLARNADFWPFVLAVDPYLSICPTK